MTGAAMRLRACGAGGDDPSRPRRDRLELRVALLERADELHTASATAALSVPYRDAAYSASTSGIARPVVPARICRRFDTPGFVAGSKRTSLSESVTALLMRLAIAFGSSSSEIVPWGESADFDIFFVGCWRSMMRAPTGGIAASGTTKVGAEAVVEADRDVAGELEVLALVVADGDALGVVGEDVGRHEHRVVEQPDAHRLLALPTSP